MSAPTIIGTVKGIFGHTEAQTGCVFESVDYKFNKETVEFPDINSQTTAVASFNESADITLKGFLVAGTTFAGTLSSILVLASTMPAKLKNGNTGGTTLIDTINISTTSKNWQAIEIGAKYYPGVTTV